MRKIVLTLAAALLSLAALAQTHQLDINLKKAGAPIPSTLYGIFFEDINYAADGGLYAELIKNRSFEFPCDALQGWKAFGKVEIREDGPFARNPHYVRLSDPGHPHKWTGLDNEGFFGIGVKEGAEVYKQNYLWSFGVDIPIFFLGRFGNLQKGYIQFGGGIFTHFTFASNIADKYKNVDDETPTPSATPSTVVSYDYSRLYSLHNNHFGVCAMVGYEFSFGMQINAQYKVSLSDIAGFYSEMKGQEVANALIYPQSVSLNIAYRWR